MTINHQPTIVFARRRPLDWLFMSTITVGAYEAKTNLAHLLSRVAKGAEVIITKHEKPIARLTAVSPIPRLSRAEALSRIAAIAAEAKPGAASAKDLINAGRRI